MRARFFIILIQFFMISLLPATESTFQIQSLEEGFPGIYQKLKKENRLSGFHLAQLTPGRDKAAILFFVNESFSQISITFPADDSFLVINSDQALFTFDRSGHQIRKFDLNAVNPQVSPDGKTAACIDFEDDGHRIIRQSIQILDLETGSIDTILIDTAPSLQSIIWLDNRRILYH